MNERELKDKKNNFTVASCSITKKIYNIAYQNDRMRTHFEKYGNVLHIDGTYCTNELNYALYFFSVKDAFGMDCGKIFLLYTYEFLF